MSAVPAGWRPDPTGRHELRYWDGYQWTDHVANKGVSAVDPFVQRDTGAIDAPAIVPTSTMGGTEQSDPEKPGNRKGRLMAHCYRVLSELPEAGDWESPLAKGYGIDEPVRVVVSIFRNELSLLPVIAVRQALSYHQVNKKNLVAHALAAGIEIADDDNMVLRDPPADMDEQARSVAIGLAASILARVGLATERLSVTSSPALERMWKMPMPNTLEAAAFIAWSAITTYRVERIGIADEVYQNFGEPSAMVTAGWYSDPVFSEGDRYWNTEDWTDRCRSVQGEGRRRRYVEINRPFP